MAALLKPGGTILLLSLLLLCLLQLLLLSCRHLNSVQFLGAFVKFRKATISFVMFVDMSFHREHLGSHRNFFMKFDICSFVENLSENSSFMKI
jgi:hypothetical protein